MAAQRQNREFELDGNRVAELMRQKGWTIEDLAAKAILSPRTISSVLNGARPCNQRTGHKIRVALRVDDIEELLPQSDQSDNDFTATVEIGFAGNHHTMRMHD